MTTSAPTGLVLFTYRVGFGDCFLLRVEYARARRHVLVDFGSTAAASTSIGSQLLEVAKDVAERCGGRLDAIVATHRHRDHVSGFAGRPWKVIAALAPRLAVLPWTDHPDAAVDAELAPSGSRGRIGAASAAHARSLRDMEEVSAAALRELRLRGGAAGLAAVPDDEGAEAPPDAWPEPDAGPPPITRPYAKGLAAQLAFVGEDNLSNAEATRNLLSLPARDFVCFGSRTRLGRLLPGVTVHVLGPPTLRQAEAIRGQRREDPGEFWHVMAAAGRRSSRPSSRALFAGAARIAPDALPLETRWFLRRLDAVRAEELLQIVRTLDDAMNNTSVILLLEAVGRRLLLPGDAQIESWSYALAHARVRELLEGVDAYKVGHHGSLNATPKSLWQLFAKRGPGGAARLKAFLSTRPGKHGSPSRGTEVPRRTLVAALDAETELVATHRMRRKQEFVLETRIA